jgi:hemerythrin-like domain-containing protein
MKATALLTEDHQQIRRALDVLAQMSAKTTQGGTFDAADAQYLLEFLKQFADRHHQGKEEGVFFPALLQDRNQKNYPSLCALIFEHNRERSLVEGFEEAIRTHKAKDFSFYADRLVEVLRTHIQKEQDDLFTLADSVLNAKQDERVALEMRDYERSWQEAELPQLLRRLAELEAVYLADTNARRVANG